MSDWVIDDSNSKNDWTRNNENLSNNIDGTNNLENIANSPGINAILGAGDALKNMLSLGYLSNSPSSNFGFTKGPNSGSGNAYNIGNIAGNIGGFIGGGEVLDAARAAGEGIPLAGRALKQLGGNDLLQSIARRISGSAIGGIAENPSDRIGGAETGAALGLAGEAIPLGFRGLGEISEIINPVKYASKLGDKIKSTYENYKDEASSFYNPVIDKFKNYHITKANPSKNFFNLDKEMIKNYFPYDAKKLYDQFLQKPTFKNAHDLQSQLGTEIGNLTSKKPDAITNNTIQHLRAARESLKSDMDSFLRIRNPNMADDYLKGSEIFREKVVPFRSNPTINKISLGKLKISDPKRLQKSLISLHENNQLNPNHFLSKALDDLSKKTSRGKAIGTIGTVLGGSLGGTALGGIGGGVTGAIAGKLLAPSAIDLATNPSIQHAAITLNPYYQALVKSIIANKLHQT